MRTLYAYVLSEEQPNTGNSRETIFFCRTKEKFETLESPVSDFEIDGKTFEVGGRKKGKKQIEDVQNGPFDRTNRVCIHGVFLIFIVRL